MSLTHTHSLSHKRWNFKYHVVFAIKYRRKVIYEIKRLEMWATLRVIYSKRSEYNISRSMPRLIFMLAEILPNYIIS